MLNVGTDLESSKEVVKMAKEHKGFYASIGLHPLYVKSADFSGEDYKKIFSREVLAVGETGIDKKGENIKKQEEIFREQIDLAHELGVPLILHCRRAHNEITEILKEKKEKLGGKERGSGVIHCFTGGKKDAREYLELGFYIGLNGIIFKMDLEGAIKEIPLERLLLETDCPFLSPRSDIKRNEPLFIEYIAKEVARIKGISKRDMANTTTENAKKLFGIRQKTSLLVK